MAVQEKKLVNEVSGWLRIFDDGSVDRAWTGPAEAKFLLDPVPDHEEFINGVAVRDVTPENAPRVRVYLPEARPVDNPGEKLPILLHFHGGGFCISNADWFMYYAFYSNLASSARSIVVSVYLRPAPENRLPAAIEDGFSTLLWLVSLARGDIHDAWISSWADLGRVFLIGDSSGGNLVHEVGVRAGGTDLSPLRLSGSIPIHPGICRSTRSRSEMEMPQTPMLTLDMVDKFLSLALPIGATKDHPITCPMGPTAPLLSGVHLPPIMYCVAEKDLFIDTEMEFYEALKNIGKEVELFVNENMGHSFYLNKMAVDNDAETMAQTQKLVEGIVDFVKRH